MKHIKLYESFNKDIKSFILENDILNNGSYPEFLYHSTSKNPNDFILDPNIDWEDIESGNDWDFDLPSGVIFLTNDLLEARRYGRYVIPFEINTNNILVKEVEGENPSKTFDDDYNYGSEYNLWSSFEGEYDVLEVKTRYKSTFIAHIESITPRIDISKKFYDL